MPILFASPSPLPHLSHNTVYDWSLQLIMSRIDGFFYESESFF
ncbi:unnamed protein product, partial [Brassica oleracea var. botrytis]